jgi:hypothetical protein
MRVSLDHTKTLIPLKARVRVSVAKFVDSGKNNTPNFRLPSIATTNRIPAITKGEWRARQFVSQKYFDSLPNAPLEVLTPLL